MKFVRKDTMPVDVIIPVIERWIKEHDTLWNTAPHIKGKHRDETPCLGGAQVLCSMAGIHLKSLTRVLNRHQANISFSLADRLLAAMDKTDLWYSDPDLNEWYTEKLDLRSAEEFYGSRLARQRAAANKRRYEKKRQARLVTA